MTKVVNLFATDSFDSKTWKLFRQWEVQRKPYVHPLPFTFRTDKRTSCTTTSGNYSPNDGQWVCGLQDFTSVKNRSYAELKAKLGDTATWANNLHEARGSIDMILKRASQITGFSRALRKGNFGWAVRELGLTDTRGKRFKSLKAKPFGDQFLEFHFGWVPMIQDIGAAMNVLQDTDFGTKSYSAMIRQPYNRFSRSGDSANFTRDQERGNVAVRQGAHFRVTNPNAFLANQMGFVNPLSVAWEAVPFSFVADWFGNVGDVLASMTDFVGVSVIDPYNTAFQSGDRTFTSVTSGTFGKTNRFTSTVAYCTRGPGLSGVTLQVKPFKGFSITRAATAISLLCQQLK